MNSQATIAPESPEVPLLKKRYNDAYLVARVTDGFGGMIKGIGIMVAILLVFIGLVFIGNGRAGDATFAMGIVAITFGIFVGILFYLLGVLVSAQGQILKASLDSAVNNSPFLTNTHRAEIMSLTKQTYESVSAPKESSEEWSRRMQE
ncbi:MAG: hypothetical protein ABR577_02220 [Pyrinomonadaceae bacterium]